MKFILKLIAVVVVLLIIAVVALVMYADRLAKEGIERGGEYALGVPTSLDSIGLGLFSGTAEMKGLAVANPPGFDASHFLRLNRGSVAVSINSLREETVEVPNITLEGVDLSIEKTGKNANYQVILDNLKKLSTSSGKPAPSDPEAGPSGGRKYVIREMLIRDVVVSVKVSGLLNPIEAKIDIPPIELKNVGSAKDAGVQLGQVAGIIVQAILTEVVKSGGGILPAELANELSSGLAAVGKIGELGTNVIGDVGGILGDELGKAAGDITGKAGEAAGDVTKKVGEAAGEATKKVGETTGKLLEGVGGFLGGEKKKTEEEKRAE